MRTEEEDKHREKRMRAQVKTKKYLRHFRSNRTDQM